MISADKIIDKLRMLEEFLAILREMRKTPPEVFLKDKILLGSAKYYMQVSIECCLDISNHIIAAGRFRAPKDYADSFKVLEEQGIVEPKEGLKLRQMAKFHNRLVHLYGEIDDVYLYGLIDKDLEDIQYFMKAITGRFLS